MQQLFGLSPSQQNNVAIALNLYNPRISEKEKKEKYTDRKRKQDGAREERERERERKAEKNECVHEERPGNDYKGKHK